MNMIRQYQNSLSELENLLQYTFNKQELLIEALSHPSLKQQQTHNHKIIDYQRLEFLGDAVLGFIISEIIYNKYPDKDEGDLAKIKAYLVCKNTICLAAKKIDLAEYLIMTEGEEISKGRDNPNNIENAMEALLAAVYFDGGIMNAKKIVGNLWQEYLEQDFDASKSDPKTTLQEWAQSRTQEKPIYKVVYKEGSAHAPVFTVEVWVGNMNYQAHGNTIKSAEKAAAFGLLEKIKTENLK